MKRFLLWIALVACEFPRPADVKDDVSVGGIVHGLWAGADGLTLRLTADGVDLTQTIAVNGSFTFPTRVSEGASYIVIVVASPSFHTCAIASAATGIVPAEGITSIDIACRGPGVSIALSAPMPWTFDPTVDVQPVVQASLLLQEVALTVSNQDGLVTSLNIAGIPMTLGKASASQRLSLGMNFIDVAVLAQSGLAMTYRLAIERGGTVVEQAVYGKASNTGRDDLFGRSLALLGDTLVVGAPGEDSSGIGVNGNQSDDGAANSGAVYIFQRDGSAWAQQAYIKASNAQPGDSFGTSVALSGDILAVSALRAGGVGAVYVFQQTSGSWVEQAILFGSNVEPEDNFGESIALSGNTLVVGAPLEDSGAIGLNGNQQDNGTPDSGAVYVFGRTATFWLQEAYIKASNTDSGDLFGFAVALSGDTLAVSARNESSCARGVNGQQLDNACVLSGAVYVFQRADSRWAQQAYVKASNTFTLAQFGRSAALVGETLVVGATFEGSSATGVNGNQSDTSALGAGAVYVFQRIGTMWSQRAYLKASNTEALDVFGAPVALSDEIVAVGAVSEDSAATGINRDQSNNGAMGAGAVYVFRRAGPTWIQEAYVKSSNTELGDLFGSSIALSGDTLVIAADQEDGGERGINRNQVDNRAEASGAVYVFR